MPNTQPHDIRIISASTPTIDVLHGMLTRVVHGQLVVLLILFFLLGKRSGKKKTTLVEIRRL